MMEYPVTFTNIVATPAAASSSLPTWPTAMTDTIGVSTAIRQHAASHGSPH